MLVVLIVNGIVAVWIVSCIETLINRALYCPVDIANEIAASGSGGSSRDCSRVDRVLY